MEKLEERQITITYDTTPEDALSMIEQILIDFNIKYEKTEIDTVNITYQYPKMRQ